MLQLWNNFFHCAISFLTQEHLQLENFHSSKRNKIISGYITNLRLEEVWYFVTNKDVRNAVERTIGSYDGFKVISWEGAA